MLLHLVCLEYFLFPPCLLCFIAPSGLLSLFDLHFVVCLWHVAVIIMRNFSHYHPMFVSENETALLFVLDASEAFRVLIRLNM